MTFDPKWPHGHVTRDGRKARIICADAKLSGFRDYPIVALIARPDGLEDSHTYTASGEFTERQSACHPGDLLNAPAPKRKVKVQQKRVVILDAGEGLLRRPCDHQNAFATIHILGEIEEGAEVTLRLP